jgi:hypothetical protein
MNRIVLYSAAAFFTVFGTTCQTSDIAQEKHIAGLKKSRAISNDGAIASIRCTTELTPSIESIDTAYVYKGSGILCPIVEHPGEE